VCRDQIAIVIYSFGEEMPTSRSNAGRVITDGRQGNSMEQGGGDIPSPTLGGVTKGKNKKKQQKKKKKEKSLTTRTKIYYLLTK